MTAANAYREGIARRRALREAIEPRVLAGESDAEILADLAHGNDGDEEEARLMLAVCRDAAAARPEWMDEGLTAASLARMELREPDFTVPGILPEGLSILASRPKMGKSWLAMGIGAAVAYGGRALSSIEVDAGRVLYLALEDGKRRLKDRLEVLGGDTSPDRLHFFTSWPRLDEGGLDRLREWLAAYPDTRLVVVDTLARVKPQTTGKRNLYETDYEALSGLQSLATDRPLSVLCVHHLRKAAADDVLDTLNGSTGLTGCADAVLVLQRCRGAADAELHVTGRDLPDAVHAMSFKGGLWALVGGAAETQSAARQAILEALRVHGAMTPKAVADTLGRERSTVRVLLGRLADAGLVRKTEAGLYEHKQP